MDVVPDINGGGRAQGGRDLLLGDRVVDDRRCGLGPEGALEVMKELGSVVPGTVAP